MTTVIKSRIYQASILLVLFAVSIAIRAPFLNRPLGSHQWLTAQTLLIHSIWYQRGIVNCGFNPVVTFDLPTDKNIDGPMGRMESPNGDRYFMSQPPFGYIFPYVVLTSIGLRPDVLPLQIFNLVVHLICVLLVFFIIRQLASDRNIRYPGLAAIVGAAVYTFMPVTLEYHGNVYSFETLVQLFFLLGIYLFLKILKQPSLMLYAGLSMTAFFMSYTEALGVLFAIAIVLYALFHFQDRIIRRAALITVSATAAALCLTLFQYSQIAGLGEFVHRLTGAYLERSGLSEHSHLNRGILSAIAWHRFGGHYIYGFGWSLLVLGAALLVNANAAIRLSPKERAAIFLAVLPVVLHHLLLFDFTAIHDYSVLKDAAFFAVFAGMLFYLAQGLWSKGFESSGIQNILNVLLFIIFLFSLRTGATQYRRQNQSSTNVIFQKSGRYIASVAKPDEVIFADFPDTELCAQIIYYARRNIALFKDDHTALELIRKNGARRGIIFTLDENYSCQGYRYLEN